MGTCGGAVVVPSSAGFHSTFFDMMPELSFFLIPDVLKSI